MLRSRHRRVFFIGVFAQSCARAGRTQKLKKTLEEAALRRREARPLPAAIALVALGIVYGDIGTSPLYAFKQAAQAGRSG